MHDVYAYGVIAPSTLYEMSSPFPGEAGYGEITAVHPSMGGEAAGGAYVLARLGIATKLAGNRLSAGPDSARVIDLLASAGVDCSAVEVDEGTPAVVEAVFVSGESRTIFGSYGRMLDLRAWAAPSKDDIGSSRVVCLDPFFGAESERAAEWCAELGVPYVTVDVAPDSPVARSAAVLVIAEEFARRTFGSLDAALVLDTYAEATSGLVILTQGSGPLLYRRATDEPKTFAPFEVDARDTAGAGDSFRAGIIYGMLRAYDDEALIETASAVAALVCLGIPGVLNSPTESELEAFLAAQAAR